MKKEVPWRGIKNLSPRELAPYLKWKQIEEALTYHYPGFKWHKYLRILLRIHNAPKKHVKENERLEVYSFNTFMEKEKELESGYGIHIIETDKMEFGKPKSWSMSFVNWDTLINTRFTDSNFEHYSAAELMAHFIWELTWYGDEEKSRKTGKRLLKLVKEVKKDIKKSLKDKNNEVK